MDLYTAVTYGQVKQVELLIKFDTDLNAKGKDGCSPLYRACLDKRLDIATMLVQAGAYVNNGNAISTPLQAASQRSHRRFNRPIVSMLIAAGADVFIDTHTTTKKIQTMIRTAQLEQQLVAFLLTSKDAHASQLFFRQPHFDENVLTIVFSFINRKNPYQA